MSTHPPKIRSALTRSARKDALRRVITLLAGILSAPVVTAATTDELAAQIQDLAAKNAELMAMLQRQQAELAALQTQLATVGQSQQSQATQIDAIETEITRPDFLPADNRRRSFFDQIILSCETGVTWYLGQPESLYPESDFTVDEARLYLEAVISDGVYLFTELEIAAREPSLFTGESVRMGEVYIEVESMGRLFGLDGGPTLRMGRIDIPFGIEYLERDVMENPFISHTLADIWGIDEGIELFGNLGPLTYVASIQNGGISRLRDFDKDKAMTLRLGFSPMKDLEIFASAMRTGDLNAVPVSALGLNATYDIASEVWLANGVLIPIGGTGTTKYNGTFAQIDARYRWEGGHLQGAFGIGTYDDNDPSSDNSRDFTFYSVDLVQNIINKLYGAARYSYIEADKGYPLNGAGNRNDYFFNGFLTKELEHFTLGLGYRFSANLVWKTEYTWEFGESMTGLKRDGTDIFATQVGVSF